MIKKLVITLFCFAIFQSIVSAQVFYPYTLGAVSRMNLSETALKVKENLVANGFRILGEYQPAEDSERWLIVITSDELLNAAGKLGKLAGFASVLRVALTLETSNVKISYTTPEYWLNAYYRDDYEQVGSMLAPVSGRLQQAMRESGSYSGIGFGSEKGMETEELRSYRYMVGMQRFQNTSLLGQFTSYQEAIDKIESNMIKGLPDVKKIYSVEVPGKNLRLYGFALGGEKGESHFLPIIDITEPKHTAFLPYEFLVMGNEVHMLHGRYRIALSFPELTMGMFTKIMSTPGDIRDLLETVVK